MPGKVTGAFNAGHEAVPATIHPAGSQSRQGSFFAWIHVAAVRVRFPGSACCIILERKAKMTNEEMDASDAHAVVARLGKEWARYLYRPMAQAVADRYNKDPAIESQKPFEIRPLG